MTSESSAAVEKVRVLITVGNTPFLRLLRSSDNKLPSDRFDKLFQTSREVHFAPNSGRTVQYVENIRKLYTWADLVICHAGAGTVFTLLEMGRRFLVVPNQARRDKHQIDLAEWLERNNLAHVCHLLKNLRACVERAMSERHNPYEPVPFHGQSEIVNVLVKKKRSPQLRDEVG